MNTMKDPSLTVYPNREQMLALIRARAEASAKKLADQADSATFDFPPVFPVCVFLPSE